MATSEIGSKAPEMSKLQDLFLSAISTRDEHLIEKRLLQGACLRSAGGEALETPLMAAASSGNLAMLKRLAPHSDVLAVDHWGTNALTHLLWTGATCRSEPDFIECLKLLASQESVGAINKSGDCPMMVAMDGETGKFDEVLEVFKPWIDWTAKDCEGMNLMSRALDTGVEENALMLWHAHPDKAWLARDVDEKGRTIAHHAAECDAPEVLKTIGRHVDFEARDKSGATPLMSASQRTVCSRETTTLLVEWSDCSAVDSGGCNALMLVIEGLHEDVKEARRDSFQELVNRMDLGAKDELGETALEKAKDRAFENAAGIIQARMDIAAEREEISRAATVEQRAAAAKAIRI